MANSVENVYSTALFQLCDENNMLDTAYEELSDVSRIIFSEGDEEFIELLSSPLISSENKTAALENIFGDKISTTVLDFLCLVSEKGRIRNLPAMAEEFKSMYFNRKNILEVTATTSVQLSDALRKKLTDKLAAVSGKTIILKEKVDKTILGGIVIRYGNTQIDSSVKTKLDNLKTQIDGCIA